MEADVPTKGPDWTSNIAMRAANLEAIALEIAVSFKVRTVDELPATLTARLGLGAGDEVAVTIGLDQFGAAVEAVGLMMGALPIGRFAAHLAQATGSRAGKFSKGTGAGCMPFNGVAPELLETASLVVRAAYAQVGQLRTGNARGTEAVAPAEAFPVDGASRTGRAGGDAPSEAAIAKGMVAGSGDGVHKRVVANWTQQIGIWHVDVGEGVHVEDGAAAVPRRDIQ